MTRTKLTDSERSTLENALSVARERYVEHGNTVAGMDVDAATKTAVTRLAEQFRRQVAEVDALAEKLIAADEIELAQDAAFVNLVSRLGASR